MGAVEQGIIDSVYATDSCDLRLYKFAATTDVNEDDNSSANPRIYAIKADGTEFWNNGQNYGFQESTDNPEHLLLSLDKDNNNKLDRNLKICYRLCNDVHPSHGYCQDANVGAASTNFACADLFVPSDGPPSTTYECTFASVSQGTITRPLDEITGFEIADYFQNRITTDTQCWTDDQTPEHGIYDCSNEPIT